MAQQKSNWLWWTLGGVALLGVGVGTYMYIRSRGKKDDLKNDGQVYIPPKVAPPSNTSTSGSGGVSVIVPFQNEMEGNAFREWVNNKYPVWATTNQLDRKGKYNNSYIQKAWAQYGVEYAQHLNQLNSSNQSSGIQDLQKVMNAMKDYGIEANSAERIQFLLYDGSGLRNIRTNFTPNGYFWIEMDMQDNGILSAVKYDGNWSFSNGKFNVKLNDNSYNGSDPNLSGMLWSMAKMKFPKTLASIGFTNVDEMFNMSGKQYVDSQDTML